MLRRTFFILAIGLLAPSVADASPKSRDPAQVPAGDYELDPRHASLIVRVPLGEMYVVARRAPGR